MRRKARRQPKFVLEAPSGSTAAFQLQDRCAPVPHVLFAVRVDGNKPFGIYWSLNEVLMIRDQLDEFLSHVSTSHGAAYGAAVDQAEAFKRAYANRVVPDVMDMGEH